MMKDYEKSAKLIPILKDLKKEKDGGKFDIDQIFDACDGKLSKEDIDQDLSKLEDLGVIAVDI